MKKQKVPSLKNQEILHTFRQQRFFKSCIIFQKKVDPKTFVSQSDFRFKLRMLKEKPNFVTQLTNAKITKL